MLFVDDEARVLEAIKRNLQEEPFTVITSTSAQEALGILTSRPVDVLVTDENMPEMTGTELLCRVRREHPNVVRIMLTGSTDLAVTTRAIDAAVPYRLLGKPVMVQELSRTIHNALRMKDLAKHRPGTSRAPSR